MYIEYIEDAIKEADYAIDAYLYDEARYMLESLLYDEPAYAKVHNNLGWLYQYHLGNKKLAELHLKWAIKFDPRMKAAYLNIVELYTWDNRMIELREILKNAIKLEFKDAFIYESLGKTYEATQDFSLAIRYYREALYTTTDNYVGQEIRADIKRCKYKRIKKLIRN